MLKVIIENAIVNKMTSDIDPDGDEAFTIDQMDAIFNASCLSFSLYKGITYNNTNQVL